MKITGVKWTKEISCYNTVNLKFQQPWLAFLPLSKKTCKIIEFSPPWPAYLTTCDLQVKEANAMQITNFFLLRNVIFVQVQTCSGLADAVRHTGLRLSIQNTMRFSFPTWYYIYNLLYLKRKYYLRTVSEVAGSLSRGFGAALHGDQQRATIKTNPAG